MKLKMFPEDFKSVGDKKKVAVSVRPAVERSEPEINVEKKGAR